MITNAPMQSSTAFYIAAGIALAGAIPLLLALYRNKRINQLQTEGARTHGFVEELQERRGIRGGVYYRALINFPAHGTRQRQYYYLRTGRHKHLLAKGNQVTVIYQPGKPKRFIIAEVPQSNALLIITAILALLYVVIACVLYNYLRNFQ